MCARWCRISSNVCVDAGRPERLAGVVGLAVILGTGEETQVPLSVAPMESNTWSMESIRASSVDLMTSSKLVHLDVSWARMGWVSASFQFRGPVEGVV